MSIPRHLDCRTTLYICVSNLSIHRNAVGMMKLHLKNGKPKGSDAYIVLAHELGHVMGVYDHDGEKSAGKCQGNTIMTPITGPPNTKWSECSR